MKLCKKVHWIDIKGTKKQIKKKKRIKKHSFLSHLEPKPKIA